MKALGWLMLALGGLAAVWLSALVIANWNDDALTEAAQRALQYTPPTEQALEGNGYVILLGLDAPAEGDAIGDAMALGRKRLAREIERRTWVEAHGDREEGMPAGIPPPQDPAGEWVLPARLRCPTDAVDCFVWYARHQEEITDLARTQAAVLQRFMGITSAPHFHNPAPPYLLAEFAPFAVLVRTHELRLAQASLAWNHGRHQQAADMAKDAVQLRRRLASGADSLIAAMIAIAMQHRELRWFSAASAQNAQSPPAAVTEAIEAMLSVPTESLAPALAGEMRSVASAFYLYRTAGLTAEPSQEPPGWWRRTVHKASNLGLLPHHTLNLSIGYLQQVQALSSLPPHQLQTAFSEASRKWAEEGTCSLWAHLRNPAGYCLAAPEAPSYQRYAQRIADIDGYRRLVLLQHRAATENVAPADMPTWLAQSPHELRNPYTLQPMQWDAATHSLVFEGREKQNQNPDQSPTYRIRLHS
ncbi:hypothetical protein [Paracidovorax sp. MALMAid1276]|uniref:hypothetical protein n=1 Tax=Paracidovorax sp. MALMAid1276 TaxID=3411631 RepID=UPI003B9D0972